MEDNKGPHLGIKGSNEVAGAAAESKAAAANTNLTHMSPEQPLALLDQVCSIVLAVLPCLETVVPTLWKARPTCNICSRSHM